MILIPVYVCTYVQYRVSGNNRITSRVQTEEIKRIEESSTFCSFVIIIIFAKIKKCEKFFYSLISFISTQK